MKMDKLNFALMITKYWYLVEFFEQSNFPVQNKEGKDACSKAEAGDTRYNQITLYHKLKIDPKADIGLQKEIVFNPLIALQNDTSKYPFYSVMSDEINICWGKIRRNLFAEKLQQVFHQKQELPEKNNRDACIIGMKCNGKGCYIPGSINISPLVWGVNKLLSEKGNLTKENIAEFLSIESYEATMSHFNSQLVEFNEDKIVGKLLTPTLITPIIDTIEKNFLLSIINSEQPVDWNGTMIYRRYKNEKNKEKDMDILRDSDLSNSFFAKDLSMVQQAIESKKIEKTPLGKELINYIIGQYAEEKPDLKWMDFQGRMDVQSTLKTSDNEMCSDFFHENLDIKKAPLGKWPSRFMPCLMQQLAINLSWQPSLDSASIFSVNGPPGTGKTTLLKEIIAGNIVERACLLANYSDPDKAFDPKYFNDGDKKDCGYSQFYNGYYDFKDDRLKDYGMLVASCNNAAVENITKELPDGTALLKGLNPKEDDGEAVSKGLLQVQDLFKMDNAVKENYSIWNNQLNRYKLQEYPDIYFTKLANDLAKRNDDNWDRWGLISAPFGKTSNLKSYINAVLKPYIRSFKTTEKIIEGKKKYDKAVEAFQNQLEKVQQMEQELQEISNLKISCQKQCDFFEDEILSKSILKTRQEHSAMKLMKKIQQLTQKSQQDQQVLRTCKTEFENKQIHVSQKEKEVGEAESQIESIKKHIMNLERSKNIFDHILDLFHHPTMLSRTIKEQYQVLKQSEEVSQNKKSSLNQMALELEQQRIACREQEQIVSEIEKEIHNVNDKHKICLEEIKDIKDTIKDLKRDIDKEKASYQAAMKKASSRQDDQAMTVLNEDFFELYHSKDVTESTEVQKSNPWQTASYNREREKLFYYALKLHKAFLLGSKHCLWNFRNLLLLWKEPRDDDKKVVSFSQRDREACFGALLNTVFLLTPVLSTTFASAGGMLSAIKNPGEIGCLIIDEAGQASPQMAVGSIYRCRRAIVVGDPKQVEPVVTDELDSIKQVIQNDYTVYYQSKTHSVQGFADRLNKVGTTYSNEEQETWVGCPLVVHRRCISPMFELSNVLSYDNMMKQQTEPPKAEKEATFCREASGWINVSGSEKNTAGKDHYVEAQGRKAWEIIKKAFQLTNGKPSLFVITPFTSVRDGLKKMIRSQPEYKKDVRFQEWVDQCIGTVHTFQGKEADQVVFLLGCDKNSLPAVRWVNTNIVNVAVTRAKYRLYVVGDYTVWQQSELFQKVKGILDSYALRSLQRAVKDPKSNNDKQQINRLLKQTPGSESLTIDGELDDGLVAPLFQELDSMWTNNSLTEEQLRLFNLTKSDLKCLSSSISQRLTSSILLHEMLAMLKKQYSLEEMDATCAVILLCKTMEALLKEVLLGKLKTLFPDCKTRGVQLEKIKENRAFISTYTDVLNTKECFVKLVSCGATLFDEICDEQWWKTYASDLDAFRLIRNTCCHSEQLSWQTEEELLKILFERREFMKTLVGKAL